jgi:hypothetical protein
VQAIATDYQPQTPELDRKFLEREAAQGLPVKGMKRTWDEGRPTVLPTMNADKVCVYCVCVFCVYICE